MKEEVKKNIIEFIKTIAISGILAAIIITFVVQSTIVSGQSMEPNIHNGERLFINKFIYRFHPPERLDIIVLKPHGDPGKEYIKRVIGLPEDIIYINDGKTYINGKPLPEEFINETMNKDYGPYQIPEGHVFVMGDNRNHSADSRYPSIVGYVDYDDIIGKAFLVYWPLKEVRLLN